MANKLVLRQSIDLPFHPQGDFDHGDMPLSNGYVFIANTAAGTHGRGRRWGAHAPRDGAHTQIDDERSRHR